MPDDNDTLDFDNGTPPNIGIIAYRLGRVEKGVEAYNKAAQDRDDKIFAKLDSIGELSGAVTNLVFRVEKLEQAQIRFFQFLGALTLAVLGIIAEIILRSLGNG